MTRTNVALVVLLVALAMPLVAQTLEQKRVMWCTVSPEEKQCRVDRIKEVMELVKAAKTEAEMNRYAKLADYSLVNKECAARVSATNTVNNGRVRSIFAEMVTFDRKSGKQWKPPFPVSKPCTAEILKILKDDAVMLTDFRASLVRAGCAQPVSK